MTEGKTRKIDELANSIKLSYGTRVKIYYNHIITPNQPSARNIVTINLETPGPTSQTIYPLAT